MAADRVVSEIVTQFFLNTCQLRRQLNDDYIRAITECIWTANERPFNDSEANFIPLTTGSVAEFYIRPMFSCVGDVDIMFHCSDQLAIPAGTAPPTQLPDEFHSRVNIYEIIDSEFPGYVYLEKSYILTECIDDGRYNAAQCPREYVSYDHARRAFTDDGQTIHGPAIISQLSRRPPPYVRRIAESVYSLDSVPCTRCLSWPSQAADWPSRHRKYGWPDSATVSCVVSNGCDIVNVAHRQCRQGGWSSKHQWRLSFSRAEVVLLNSWMSVQQIVYHMLRVFVKTERLTDSVGAKAFSNYHIKTLMLWACELRPRSWWNLCRTATYYG